jgi:hypothetical protein
VDYCDALEYDLRPSAKAFLLALVNHLLVHPHNFSDFSDEAFFDALSKKLRLALRRYQRIVLREHSPPALHFRYLQLTPTHRYLFDKHCYL